MRRGSDMDFREYIDLFGDIEWMHWARVMDDPHVSEEDRAHARQMWQAAYAAWEQAKEFAALPARAAGKRSGVERKRGAEERRRLALEILQGQPERIRSNKLVSVRIRAVRARWPEDEPTPSDSTLRNYLQTC